MGIFSLGKNIRHLSEIWSLFPDKVFPDKVFKNGPSKICARQPLKKLSDMVCLSSSNFLKAVFHKFYFTNSILEYFAPVLLCICCTCRSIDRKIDWLSGLVFQMLTWFKCFQMNPRRHTTSFKRRSDVVQRRIDVETKWCV